MVGEFPELQGLMGGYYAAAQGEDLQVAEAIRDHYKPVGQGDEVPTAPLTVAVSLADKLDTIAGFFLIGEKPTGSKDPFALRRAALGLIELTLINRLSFETMHFFARATGFYLRQLEKLAEYQTDEWADGLGKLANAEFYGAVTDFLIDRLKVQQRSADTRYDLIDAVFETGDDQPVRLLARVKALQAFVGTEDGTNLLTGYRRAANILKKEGWDDARQPTRHPGLVPGFNEPQAPASAEDWMPEQVRHDDLGYTPEPEEAALIAALDAAAPAAADAVAAEDFERAMAALATLRAPIDAFFDAVTVNDADPAKRDARLALLARIRDAVHGVADFSKIEG
jgi:glycyl-tRNA synthetase beta chain